MIVFLTNGAGDLLQLLSSSENAIRSLGRSFFEYPVVEGQSQSAALADARAKLVTHMVVDGKLVAKDA